MSEQQEMVMDRQGKYRGRLPQLDGGVFLTDGGLETTLDLS